MTAGVGVSAARNSWCCLCASVQALRCEAGRNNLFLC